MNNLFNRKGKIKKSINSLHFRRKGKIAEMIVN